MDYGVRWRHVLDDAKMGAAVGVLLDVGLGGVLIGQHLIGADSLSPWTVLLLLVLPVGVALLYSSLCAFKSLFRVRVRRHKVEYVVAGIVLQRRPLSRLVGTVETDHGPAVLFEGGDRIHLPDFMEGDELVQLSQGLLAAAVTARAAQQAGCAEPPHPVKLAPEWLSWQDGAVGRIAAELGPEASCEQLGVLADALEDAGCRNEALLSHLRAPIHHVGGCWAIDLVANHPGAR